MVLKRSVQIRLRHSKSNIHSGKKSRSRSEVQMKSSNVLLWEYRSKGSNFKSYSHVQIFFLSKSCKDFLSIVAKILKKNFNLNPKVHIKFFFKLKFISNPKLILWKSIKKTKDLRKCCVDLHKAGQNND